MCLNVVVFVVFIGIVHGLYCFVLLYCFLTYVVLFCVFKLIYCVVVVFYFVLLLSCIVVLLVFRYVYCCLLCYMHLKNGGGETMGGGKQQQKTCFGVCKGIHVCVYVYLRRSADVSYVFMCACFVVFA